MKIEDFAGQPKRLRNPENFDDLSSLVQMRSLVAEIYCFCCFVVVCVVVFVVFDLLFSFL